MALLPFFDQAPIFFSENAKVAHLDDASPKMSVGSLLSIAFAATSPCAAIAASCMLADVLLSSMIGVPLEAVSASISCSRGSDVI